MSMLFWGRILLEVTGEATRGDRRITCSPALQLSIRERKLSTLPVSKMEKRYGRLFFAGFVMYADAAGHKRASASSADWQVPRDVAPWGTVVRQPSSDRVGLFPH